MAQNARYVRFFSEIGIDDIPLVGGKNASLGEMYRYLAPMGVRIPNGFAITANAYRDRLTAAGAWDDLHKALDGLDPADLRDLAQRAQAARNIVYSAPIPKDMREEILQAYRQLQTEYGDGMSVAVRSSATAEDLPTASFAGQQDTYLNVRGEEMLLDSCRRCFASLFIDRAIHYRVDQGFDHFKVALSIGVMKMVRSDQAASGVMFSLDTESGFRDVVFITAAYGLGENIVQGAVDPDEFTVFKPTFLAGHRHVLRRVLGSKKIKMIYTDGDIRATTRNIPVPREAQEQFSISDEDVLTLADYAIKVEQHYSRQAGEPRPMDMEWAKDGVDGRIYLVQARPETVASRKNAQVLEEYQLQGQGPLLTQGRAVGVGIATGRAHVIPHVTEIGNFHKGEILVADTTTPDWEPIMKHAAGIITNRGGRTCHAAIIARELGIPAIVGTDNATRAIADGEMVTLSCAEGNTGNVYRGALPFVVKRHDLTAIPKPATAIMINIGNPDQAFKTRFLPNDGVGLARMEFIIAEAIRVHPMALVHPDRVQDAAERETIAHLTRGYARPADFLIERLAEGVGTIAAAFHPNPVIVRMSDFKTNEYASLLGGRWFEAHEDNPMLGFRGASRYTHPDYADGFALECAAMRRVREDLGLTNVKLMIPFCRRVDEAERVMKRMAELGLARGSNGLEIYMMVEIPNNVLLLDEFARYFDGFSIGSNDLTQLTLGVDRDARIVAFDYDERDPGVKTMIRMAVEGCRRTGRHSGLCGQAPSDYPEMAEFLVELGIDSVSLNPDAVVATTLHILEVEKRLGRPPRPGTR